MKFFPLVIRWRGRENIQYRVINEKFSIGRNDNRVLDVPCPSSQVGILIFFRFQFLIRCFLFVIPYFFSSFPKVIRWLSQCEEVVFRWPKLQIIRWPKLQIMDSIFIVAMKINSLKIAVGWKKKDGILKWSSFPLVIRWLSQLWRVVIRWPKLHTFRWPII